MAEPNFIKVNTPQELVGYLHTLAEKYPDSFTGSIIPSSPKGIFANIHVNINGKDAMTELLLRRCVHPANLECSIRSGNGIDWITPEALFQTHGGSVRQKVL
jgi:hypothetical protein